MVLERRFLIVSEATDIYSSKITSSETAYKHIRNIIDKEKIDIFVKEYFYVVGVNNANITNGYMKISEGGINQTVIEIRHIAKFLINNNCMGYILFHNHPSGNKEKSQKDLESTNRIKEAINLFDIQIIDHLIIAGDNYLSFKDEGLL